MKRVIYIAGGVIAVVIIGLLSAPFLVPASLYKERIQEAASSALGREVTLAGETKLSLFPRIEARTGETVIANPEGFGDAPFAEMTELRAAVKLLPLLSSRVEIDEFVLVDPKINLIRREDGEANWVFGGGASETPTETEPSDTSEGGGGGGGGGDFAAVLGDIRLVNGEISYEDRQAGQSHKLESLDIKVNMDAMDKPLTFDGDGVLDGMAFDLDARIDNTDAILSGETSPVDVALETDILTGDISGEVTGGDALALALDFDLVMPSIPDAAAFFQVEDLPAETALGRAELAGRVVGAMDDLSIEGLTFSHASELLTATFDGGARISETISFAGDIDLAAPDLRALAASADAELPPGDVYRSFAFSGSASGDATSIALTDATLNFDDIAATGAATLNLAGKPELTGELYTAMLDATPYAAASSGGEAAETSGDGGWGGAPIDLSPLNLANVELDLTADALKFQNWDIGQSVLAITLRDGRLVADLKRTSLYGGAGVATITADGGAATPKVGVRAELQGLDIQSFLGAAANFDRVEGGGAFEINIAGEGATVDSLMSSLAGAGSFDFADGAIRGVNLSQLVRSAQEALTTGALPSAMSDEAETDFTDLTGSFTIANGVASTADLSLLSPFLTVEGGGSLDIGGQALNLSLYPESRDDSFGLGGFGVPIKLSGPWSSVSAGLDTDWLTSRATDAIAGELRNELGSVLGGALGLSNGDDAEDDDEAEETPDLEDAAENAVRNALGGLFDN